MSAVDAAGSSGGAPPGASGRFDRGPSGPPPGAPRRLETRGLSKSFGTTRALVEVSLSLEAGAVHAVLGENGAGKSTLMKLLAGAERPDAGSMVLDEQPYAPRDPSEARQRGVAIVHQELSLCPHLSVAENVVLGSEPRRCGVFSRSRARERAARALALVCEGGRTPALDTLVAELSPAERQRVEIARALDQDDCRLLIVDEPTSSLGEDDVARLFETLRRLRDRGLSVLYVSHFLEEVRRIAQRYTVLRDGRAIESGNLADVDNDALVAAMAGRAIAAPVRHARVRAEPILSLRELGGERWPTRASLELYRGEVLGIAGLVGSGRSELLRAVFGLERVRRGQLRVGAWLGPATPAQRLAGGVGFASEDRAHEGLALQLGVGVNLTLSKPVARWGWLSAARERAVARDWMTRLGVVARGPEQSVGELSGGNQQKIALGRLLYHDVDVLLLDEPTRGIDVRSRAEIHRAIDDNCRAGKAVLLVSSQFEELLAVCDRIAVMHRGVLGEARAAAGLTEHQLVKEAAGA